MKISEHFNPESTYQLLVFSDTHISHFSGLFNSKSFKTGIKLMARRRKAFIEHLTKEHGLDGEEHILPIVHLGDITDTGTYEEYEFAEQILKENFELYGIDYKKDVLYIPGNHDSRNVGDLIYEEFFGERRFFYKNNENIILVGLDSSIPDQNGGKLGARAREEIYKLVEYPEEATIILCFHHHLLPIPFTGRERSTISDAGDVVPSLFDSNIDIVLTAHRHIPNLYSISNGTKNIVIVSSGTFSSNKTRGKAGHTFAEILVDTSQQLSEVYIHPISPYSLFSKKQHLGHRQFISRPITTELNNKIKKTEVSCSIAILSDTHFTTKGDFQEKIFLTGLNMINQEPKLKVVLHAGNLTENGFPESYALAKSFLRNFNVPLIIVPGPRDLTPLGKELFIREIGPLNPFYEDDCFYIYGINTGSSSSGNVGRSQLQLALHEMQEHAKDRIFILLMHHSCLPLPKTPFKNVVQDAGDVIGTLTQNYVPLVISGAEHISNALQVENTLFVNAGTFSSYKIKNWRMNTYLLLKFYFEFNLIALEEVSIHSGFRYSLGTFPLTKVHYLK